MSEVIWVTPTILPGYATVQHEVNTNGFALGKRYRAHRQPPINHRPSRCLLVINDNGHERIVLDYENPLCSPHITWRSPLLPDWTPHFLVGYFKVENELNLPVVG